MLTYLEVNRSKVKFTRPNNAESESELQTWWAVGACAINYHGQLCSWVTARGRGHTVSAAPRWLRNLFEMFLILGDATKVIICETGISTIFCSL